MSFINQPIMYNFTTSTEKEYYDVLVKALEAIKANPEHWDQKRWHCGTSHCLGGFGDLIRERGEDLRLDEPMMDRPLSPFSREYPGEEALPLIFRPENTLGELEYLIAAIGEHGFACDFKSLPDYYDEDGYNRNGRDREDYDREGYDRSGYDREGRDREGYGWNGYDREGYDREGYNRNGYDKHGNPKP